MLNTVSDPNIWTKHTLTFRLSGAALGTCNSQLVIPWMSISDVAVWPKYIAKDTFPPNFQGLADPSKLPVGTINSILKHWNKRNAEGHKLVEFLELPPRPKKGRAPGKKNRKVASGKGTGALTVTGTGLNKDHGQKGGAEVDSDGGKGSEDDVPSGGKVDKG